MGESIQHQQQVRRILDYIKLNFLSHRTLVVLHDLPSIIGGEKPPRLGGFTPDVYAIDAPTTIAIVGEAKTTKDIENEHTVRQLTAFVTHLRAQPRGLLVISVPWQSTGVARGVIRRTIESMDAHPPKVGIILLCELAEYKIY